jgi:hypothetical protein
VLLRKRIDFFDEYAMEEILSVLVPVQGIEAISLGGSRALGVAGLNSDYDVVLHRRDQRSFTNADLLAALQGLGEECKIMRTPSLISASMGGKKYEFFLKDLSFIEREVEQAKQGRFKWFVKPLFPHGDLSTTALHHVINLDCLFDRVGALGRVRDSARPVPAKLLKALMQYFSVQMDVTVIHALKIKKYADLQYLIALASQFMFFFDILMFAVNDEYPVLEKGGASVRQRLAILPIGYEQHVRVLQPVSGVVSLQSANEAMQKLNSLVQDMVKKKLQSLVDAGH